MNALINTFGTVDLANTPRADETIGREKHFLSIYGWIASLARPLAQLVDTLRQRQQSLRTVNALTRLDDKVLQDIGISRGEILGIADERSSGRSTGQRLIGSGDTRYRPYH